MEPRSRSVLDTPLFAGYDGSCGAALNGCHGLNVRPPPPAGLLTVVVDHLLLLLKHLIVQHLLIVDHHGSRWSARAVQIAAITNWT
jgi:hypothetical protein